MAEKIAFAKSQLEETKGIMIKNVESVLERGEKLESLDAKSQELSESSYNFRRMGRSLKCQFMRGNVWKTLAIIIILLMILGVMGIVIYEIVRHV